MVLEAIRYERGNLKLLEQRKLPYETSWVDIKTCEDGWQAIRDMTVRGAPAIAISGALSLAVELVNSERFSSAAEAADVIEKKLRYLETRCVCSLVDWVHFLPHGFCYLFNGF